MPLDVDQTLKRYGAALDELRAIDIELEHFEALSPRKVNELRKAKVRLELELQQMRESMDAHTAAQNVAEAKANNLTTHGFKNNPHGTQR